MSFKDLERKVIDCASLSVLNISQERIMSVIQMIRDIEKVKNVGEIVRIISDSDGELS